MLKIDAPIQDPIIPPIEPAIEQIHIMETYITGMANIYLPTKSSKVLTTFLLNLIVGRFCNLICISLNSGCILKYKLPVLGSFHLIFKVINCFKEWIFLACC